MASRFCFIVNPRSGRAARVLARVRTFAARRDGEVILTERRRHACELAAAAVARGCGVIVAVGGDGTMNEIAGALVGTGATLGLVPCGSGDGLGRHLKIHGTPERALRLLDEGVVRTIDTATANGHPFFTVAGLGFEAEIARRFNALARRGFRRYVTTSAQALRRWEPRPYEITADGRVEQVLAFTLAVANADQYGNDARIAPAARVDDGLLNLTAVPPVTWANGGPLLYRLFTGSLGRARGVHQRVGAAFDVACAVAGEFHTDGELHEPTQRVAFRVRPASLRIVVGKQAEVAGSG